MGSSALIGLGSNLGDRKANLDGAVAVLAGTPGVEVRAVSSYRETAPVGGPGGQGAFLNAAASVESGLSPHELRLVLHAIEARAGRVRGVRWGERTLDLDLLLFGAQVLETPELQVPHPRMVVRRFVLAPLAEVAPDAVDPLTGRTVSQLLANLDRRPRSLALSIGESPNLFSRLISELSAVGLRQGDGGSEWDRLDVLGTTEPRDDRWVITDSWSEARPPRESTHWSLAGRISVPEPTFVVLTTGNAWGPSREGVSHDQRSARAGGAPPILRIRSADLETIVAEALAACAATGPR